MTDQLWTAAKRDLLFQADDAPGDPCVWEHSERVARIAGLLPDIPELRGKSIDRPALTLAALYHDAGWVIQARSRECHARDILLRPASDIQRELAAEWVAEGVTAAGPGVCEFAARIIRQMNNRRTDLLEARILADAENLDEIGPHSICLMIRKMCAEGKTLVDVLAVWERQAEYKYWPARIKDGFHFESVRQVALRRFDQLSRFMVDLRQTVRLEDLDSLARPPAFFLETKAQ